MKRSEAFTEKKYYRNKQIKSIIPYRNGKASGKAFFYHENGNLKSTGNFENNMRVGAWEYFHDDNTVDCFGSWTGSKREGEWVFYSRDGILLQIMHYENDKENRKSLFL